MDLPRRDGASQSAHFGKVDHRAASHDRFDQSACLRAFLGLVGIIHPFVAGQQRFLLDRSEVGLRAFA